MEKLYQALQLALRLIGSPLNVSDVTLEMNHRFCQVMNDEKARMFCFDLWDRGVMLAYARTPDPLAAARSLRAWLEEKATISQMRALFPFVAFEEIAEPFENDAEVEWKWQKLEEWVGKDRHMAQLLPLIVAGRERDELRQLFPYTSHVSLRLSRCTGYPFSGDCPSAVPTKTGHYVVFNASGIEIGKGDAETAVQLLIDHLPPNSGRARKGPAYDLQV
jgi:hypothetical protein